VARNVRVLRLVESLVGSRAQPELVHGLAYRPDERGDAFAGQRRDREVGPAGRFTPACDTRRVLRGSVRVHLVADDDLRTFGKILGMSGEFTIDDREVLKRVATLVATGEIKHVQDERGALDVPEERVAETRTLARSLDEPRDIGDHE